MDDWTPVPKYGDLWRLTLSCGHRMLTSRFSRWFTCPWCGVGGRPLIQRIHRG